MSEDDPDYTQASSSLMGRDSNENRTASSGRSRLLADNSEDIAVVRKLYYPCFGNVDLKSYVDARIYGLSFRRMHDEWVVMGKPRLDTRHWPRMAGHGGLPISPEDFVNVAEYYDRKLFSQVILAVQGKPANRDRPLDDFIVSMVTTAAVVIADFVVYRLVRDKPSVEEVTALRTWHQHFSTFLHDSIRHFCNERKVCDRLGAHECVLPLLFGQAVTMSLPTLLETFDYQVQIFQNLFPNFGEHISRCALARPLEQWVSPSDVTGACTRNANCNSDHVSSHHPPPNSDVPQASNTDQGYSMSSRRIPYEGGDYNIGTTDFVNDQLQDMGSSRRLTVAVVPKEVKRREDLFASSIDTAIQCDVPLEKVISLIDSKLSISTSTPASAASTPLSITATAPIQAAQQSSSGLPSQKSVPSSDTDWPKRRWGGASDMSTEGSGADIESTNLTFRPLFHSHASWSGSVPGRANSEGHSMITPEEALAMQRGRAHNDSTISYCSSLPTTPTELLAPNSLTAAQEGSQVYFERRPYRSNTGPSPTTSPSELNSRKRTRAEQNREKMKAYHRRVMQQREALTSVLADMSAHVGGIPRTLSRTGVEPLLGTVGGDRSASIGMTDSIPGPGSVSSFGRSTQDQSWSVSLRNKQKQESKARLRKREIDQVHELGLYAGYATATLTRTSGGDSLTTSGASSYARSSSTSKSGDEQSGLTTAWRQLHGYQVAEADLHVSQSIIRVFLRHRPSWIALISAEQRLASEVAKLSARTEEEKILEQGGRDRDDISSSFGGKGIKALIDRLQMEGRTGSLAMASGETSALLPGAGLYDPPTQMSRGNTGVGSSAGSVGAAGSGTSKAVAAQQFVGQSTYSQPGFIEAGAVVLSPGESEYGAAISPSGVTRAMGAEERGDYFGQERRRYGGRYSGESDAAASVLAMPMAGGYSAEQTGAQFARTNAVYNAFYGGEGSQQRTGTQEMERQAPTSSMSGLQQVQAASSMQGMQLRVSTPYDARAYGQQVLQAAPASRMEPTAGMYHAQTVQAHSYGFGHAPSSSGLHAQGEAQSAAGLEGASASILQYRTGQPGSPQYAPHQQHAYGQQGPQGGLQ